MRKQNDVAHNGSDFNGNIVAFHTWSVLPRSLHLLSATFLEPTLTISSFFLLSPSLFLYLCGFFFKIV